MNVLVTGASGLVGRAVRAYLQARGHRVVPLQRHRAEAGAPWWDPAAGAIDLAPGGPWEGVVHLAGESIAGGRWTAARKARIRDSRVRGTELLSRALAAGGAPPAVLVSASAIGFYGDRGDAVLDEGAAPGAGFLCNVCRAWEAAAAPAAAAGIRVVHPRIGLVLARDGGALPRMVTPFRLGLGGILGGGRQYMSWVTLRDLLAILEQALTDPRLAGPVNAVAPGAVTNREFTRSLGRVLGRPALLPAPAWALRLALGEMADALLLASARVSPGRLLAANFAFRDPELDPALRHVLG